MVKGVRQMSRYVMSDIHGCYSEFMEMLNKINFSDDDELYILGDIFDRGPQPLKVFDYILERKNIVMLKGNHEKMFQDAIENKDYILWYFNGGYVTHSQLHERGQGEIEKVYSYVKELPLIKVVDKFIFVHAGCENYDDSLEFDEFLAQSEDICVWSRENIGKEKKVQGLYGYMRTYPCSKYRGWMQYYIKEIRYNLYRLRVLFWCNGQWAACLPQVR